VGLAVRNSALSVLRGVISKLATLSRAGWISAQCRPVASSENRARGDSTDAKEAIAGPQAAVQRLPLPVDKGNASKTLRFDPAMLPVLLKRNSYTINNGRYAMNLHGNIREAMLSLSYGLPVSGYGLCQ